MLQKGERCRGFPVNVSFLREAGAMKEADIATWSSATAVLQPLSVREYCPFSSSNIAYSEYIAGERERRNTEIRARENSYVSSSDFEDSLTETT
jgi:hypothetical protein